MTHKPTLRVILAIVMYAGIGLFLFPYVTGKISAGIIFLIIGALVAVSSGLVRCFLTEGECSERTISRPIP